MIENLIYTVIISKVKNTRKKVYYSYQRVAIILNRKDCHSQHNSCFKLLSKYCFNLDTSAILAQVTPYNNPNARINKNIIDKYFQLPQPENRILAEYIWIDGTGDNMRGKTRVLDYIPKSPQGKKNIYLHF